MEDLNHALDLDEVVAVEAVDHLGDVIPHFRVQLARAVSEQERKIQFAALFLTDLLRMHQETGGDYPVGLDFIHKRRFHGLAGGSSPTDLAGAASGFASAAGFGLPPCGMTPRNRFLWRAATSSLVVVWGFNSTASFQ